MFILVMHRMVTKMDKSTGSKLTFMPNHPELGRLDSLALYADNVKDGKKIIFWRTHGMHFSRFDFRLL
jgi:hypothetical protein